MLTPIPRTYPDSDPGARWTTAIQALISVLGQDAVLIDSALSGSIDPNDLPEAESATDKRKVPSVTVCPGFTDQLSAVLKITNKFAIPLLTFSRGKNLIYGGPVPRVHGSVVLDLHRMD